MMARPTKAMLLSAFLVLAVSGCAHERHPQPEVTMRKMESAVPVNDGGTGLVGPAGGAMIGMAIGSGSATKWAVGAGVALGYIASGSEGPTLSGLPAQARNEAIARMMTTPLREQVTWFTASEKASGKITPVREFRDERGRLCRDFVEWRTLRGMNGHTTGTACL